MIPSHVLGSLQSVCPHVRIVSATRVGGGCISPAARIETEAGPRFLKWRGDRHEAGLFHAEASGLRTLAAVNAVQIPVVEAAADDWILMQWLEPGSADDIAWSRFGAGLARLHRSTAAEFGWEASNYIGALRQSNRRHKSWPAFWRAERIEPQLARAVDNGHFSSAQRRALAEHLENIDELLADGTIEGPSLVHGDLWSGNAHVTAGVGIALIDPAVYYGHREVDLAMAALFGGFPRAFWHAYEEEWPLHTSGYERRRAAYQLYYLLVHVNLFGASYVSGAMESVRQARL